ncbi:MAG TPA: glycine/betaine/sarcosine/D-proline family reductase selenoprotein B, partial [Acidimicrobiales bacterium]|nr:glycine/betaine/sarcosine/D-proline family reductase selenoprotein B [Acidimicrobiales bacterium]
MTRVVHYLNQFFTGVGGEDAASSPPARADGAVGPGRKLQALLGDDFEVVATVSCGDDYAAGEAEAVGEILALVKDTRPDVVVIGPAFSSGRYGLACG